MIFKTLARLHYKNTAVYGPIFGFLQSKFANLIDIHGEGGEVLGKAQLSRVQSQKSTTSLYS